MRRASAIALLLACAAAGAQTVQQPRPFGYTVGDLATQRVLLPAGGNPSLPEPGRANTWLERRAARIERAADGRRWLAVDYQVITAPRTLASVTIPAWELPGTPPLRVPAATISVGPLTTAPAAGQAVPLRADHAAPLIATDAMQRRLWLWLAALGATLVAWLAFIGWNSWRARSTRPFARALRQLRTRGTAPADARVALHHAFDRTAGRVLHAGSLATLFERAPWLRPVQARVERFYADSAGLFFGRGLPADAESPLLLCRQLRRLERRNLS
jgi:mxaA protein